MLLLLIGFWAYGTKVSGDTRATVVSRQVASPVDGDDCAVFDQIDALSPALSKMRTADAKFLRGEGGTSAEHAEFVRSLDLQIDGVLATHTCARASDRITEPAHWQGWLVLVKSRAELAAAGGDVVSALTDLESLWRVGHVLQSDLGTWEQGAGLVETASESMLPLLRGASPASYDSAVKRIDGLVRVGPDLHAVLDYAVYTGELEAFDDSASGLLAGFTGLGLAQAVNVFHPVYDRYVALRELPWAERSTGLESWQIEVDGYAHPIYKKLQGGAILDIERIAAAHRAKLELIQLAARAARFRRTYGACPADLERLELDGLEQPFGAYTIEGCVLQSPDGPSGPLKASAL
ncbi:MAG: hypothetical protein KC912_14375 [Proteobacteria bacterium]|nr:hypothetical protein [Pseudomonadota bacterium]